MSGWRAALVLLAAALAAPAPAQERVVTGISADTIALTADFDGSELLMFGAVRRDAPIDPAAGPLDIVITVKGPPAPVTVRRKERRFGIWVNADSVEVRAAPTFYAVASTRPVEEILSATERLRYRIGLEEAVRRVAGSLIDPRGFTTALIRLREAEGSYSQLGDAVKLAEDTLFQTRITMPANLVEGDYEAGFFLVRDGEVISTGTTAIRVEKTGIERWLYNLAHGAPLLYGILSVAVALAAGWLAATAFQLARR